MSWQYLLTLSLLTLGVTTLISYALSFVSRHWAVQYRALDIPRGERKIHESPIPLWGGIGIGLTLGLAVLILGFEGSVFSARVSGWQLLGFLLGLGILNFGGMLDDRYELKPRQSLIFPVLAAFCVAFSGTTILHVTNPGTSSAFFLDWWTWHPFHNAWGVSLPSDFLTFVWMLVAIYATKITDGLDGLVTGITVIGAAIVGTLSATPTYFQPSSTILAASVAGSYLGFLPRNIHPAKQFLGEGGSTMAGYCLGFLAIVSSAKIAIALAVLAVPVADVFFVMLRRWRHHQPIFKGDSTHLHFRLLAAGLAHRPAVYLLWAISASAGILALTLQTRGKIFLIASLALVAYLISWLADRAIKRRVKK